jgi:TatD DNase family protein
MNRPESTDFIDFHTHGASPEAGIFAIESLMVSEQKEGIGQKGIAYSAGIHPWYLTDDNIDDQINRVRKLVHNEEVIAVGEAGFDRIRGASAATQLKAFEAQVALSEEVRKPLVIHCVKGWDELLAVYKSSKPTVTWAIHGFHGKPELAEQIFSRGICISIWFSFAMLPYSSGVLKMIPPGMLFLETDGSNIPISDIYNKVSADIGLSTDELKLQIYNNFINFFNCQGN